MIGPRAPRSLTLGSRRAKKRSEKEISSDDRLDSSLRLIGTDPFEDEVMQMTSFPVQVEDQQSAATSSKLRIAQVAPLLLCVPPKRYGGTERVVHALTEELVRLGHDVTLFAARGSRTSAHLRQASDGPLWGRSLSEQVAGEVSQVESLVYDADGFDIIHSHVEYLLPLASGRLTTPALTTLHGRLDRPEMRALCQAYRPALVSISNAQRIALADLDLDWVATVHNGLPLRDLFRLGRGDGGYLVFLGRIHEDKDPETAIRVAIRAGIPIKIAARVDPADEPYFRAHVMPHLSHPLVEWTGQLDDRQKAVLLEGALALLMPVDWPEPFGLTFVEALAAGTPVISRRRGSLPELIEHGVNGFLCEGDDELAEACHMARQLDRQACRASVLDRYSAERMAGDYVKAYRQALARPSAGLEEAV